MSCFQMNRPSLLILPKQQHRHKFFFNSIHMTTIRYHHCCYITNSDTISVNTNDDPFGVFVAMISVGMKKGDARSVGSSDSLLPSFLIHSDTFFSFPSPPFSDDTFSNAPPLHRMLRLDERYPFIDEQFPSNSPFRTVTFKSPYESQLFYEFPIVVSTNLTFDDKLT